MAGSRRRRQTKHRGNAAGIVEHRGRTSKPTEASKKQAVKGGSKQRGASGSQHKYDKPPTWKSAITRSIVTSALFFAAMYLLLKYPLNTTAALSGAMLVAYVPLAYYMDLTIYKRRQRKALEAKQRGGK